MPIRRLSEARLPAGPESEVKPVAVLIDGSALFLASRAIVEANARLNYKSLVEVMCKNMSGLKPARPATVESPWVMWTAAAADNEGQQKFLDFAERELNWEVRRFPPSLSFTTEPSVLFGVAGAADPSRVGRLVRFDAAISFAIGRLADRYRIVVVSDSYPLAEPMHRVNDFHSDQNHCTLAFFGRAIDPRWYVAFKQPNAPLFLNLDDFEPELFGLSRREVAQKPSGSGLMY